MTDDIAQQQEIEHVRRELFDDDVYHADRVFSSEQVWLDVGSHVGLFTTLATSYGASVVGGIDANPDMARAYRAAHDLPCQQMTVSRVKDILRALDNIELHSEGPYERANAIKLDIQGAELPILVQPSQVASLARHFDTLLAEIHDQTLLPAIILHLRDAGLKLDYAEAADDILTGQPTFIIHARK